MAWLWPFRREAPTVRAGLAGERAAARALRRVGFRVIDRNLRTPAAEIDLLCEEGDSLVIVEVKSGKAGGPPPERNLGVEQRGRLLRAAAMMCRDPRARGRGVRIDVVTVRFDAEGRVGDVRHYRGAVRR